MKPLFLDVETLKFPLAEPFHPYGKLMYIGVDDGQNYFDFDVDYSELPFAERMVDVVSKLTNSEILVGANIKFDLHWLRRYGCCFFDKLIWDVLLVQFIINHQTTQYNSLNDVAAQWGLGQKEDVVKTEYWDKGIDTDKVPEDILRSYLKQDIQLTKQIYEHQYQEVVKRGLLPLIRLHNQDILMLEEMEWNGNLYDVKGSRKEAAKVLLKIREIKQRLNALSPIKPRCWSGDFISQILFGGVYKYKTKEKYNYVYKDGSTKEKEHWVDHEHVLPRQVEPPKKKLKKEGFFPTDADTLGKLRATGDARKIIKLLLEMAEKEHFFGTYLKGFPLRIATMKWERNLIHTNYNQTVAVTGRLSSSKPNCQNNPPEQKKYFISRFGERNDTKTVAPNN